MKTFFWIHIKKSGGQSLRELLQPYYALTDRSRRPECFTSTNSECWNDILNNYRIPLGTLQFKRALFAARHLYPDDWPHMLSFAFSREPISRCLSMYRFLLGDLTHIASTRGISFRSEEERFGFFLQLIRETFQSDTNAGPCGLRFSTHVNPMWNDVTDDSGKVCVTEIFRLEDMLPALLSVYRECGLSAENLDHSVNRNQTKKEGVHDALAVAFGAEIERLYEGDFHLYHQLCAQV
jgi:hypothetical protein